MSITYFISYQHHYCKIKINSAKAVGIDNIGGKFIKLKDVGIDNIGGKFIKLKAVGIDNIGGKFIKLKAVSIDNIGGKFIKLKAVGIDNIGGKFIKLKDVGIDNIGGKFIKDGATIFADHITKLCDLSISLFKFPSECKIAKLKPLYKKGSKLEAKNTDQYLCSQRYLKKSSIYKPRISYM